MLCEERSQAPDIGIQIFDHGVVALAVTDELIAVIVVLAEPKLLPVAFWALFAIAYHHYDTLYRSLQNAAPPRWLVWLGFGWDGRLLLAGALALAVALQPGLLVLTIWWGLWFAGMASIQWLRNSR